MMKVSKNMRSLCVNRNLNDMVKQRLIKEHGLY
jgi:hypothetical protein